MQKKNIPILTVFLITNLCTFFLLLPYAQQSANSHMNSGPAFGIIYVIVSLLLLFISIYWLIKRKDVTMFLLILFLALNLSYWAYKLYTLHCLECSKGG